MTSINSGDVLANFSGITAPAAGTPTDSCIANGITGNVIAASYQNLCVGMQARTSMTSMQVLEAQQVMCVQAGDITGSVGPGASRRSMIVRNFEVGNFPIGQVCADITSPPGLGGSDQSPVPGNQWLWLHLMTDGTAANTGLVWSTSPFAPVTTNLPAPSGGIWYSCPLAANRTNAAGTAFVYSLIKVGKRSYFVGGAGPGPGAPGNGSLPLVCSGMAPMYTSVNLSPFGPPTGGPIGLVMTNSTPSTYVGAAPNIFWNSTPPWRIGLSAAGGDQTMAFEVQSDCGATFGYWATSPSALIEAAYFDDPNC